MLTLDIDSIASNNGSVSKIIIRQELYGQFHKGTNICLTHPCTVTKWTR